MKICKIDGCDGAHYALGLCRKHWNRNRKHGSPDDRLHVRAPVEVRFWRFVDKGSRAPCWEWTGARQTTGYGVTSLTGGRASGRIGAHRLSYQMHCGEIPEGMVIMHSCDNPWCVNPDHLSVGTHAENTADMHTKGRANRPIGSQSSVAKLTEEAVREIRASSLSQRKLAEKYGVGATTIRNALHGRYWSHVK
jgi:hypothetical protein